MQNAQQFEANTALCKVSTKKDSYIVRYVLYCTSIWAKIYLCVFVYLYAAPVFLFVGWPLNSLIG